MSKSDKKAKRGSQGPSGRFSVHALQNHPFVIPVATFLMLFFFSIAAFISAGGQTVGAGDTRIVRLTVDGRQQVVPTRAATVEELVERLDLELNEKDIVEPALGTEIDQDNFSVNVYKARPVTVVDKDRSVTTFTAEPTPHGVAKQAGVEVYPEDKLEKRAEIVDPDNIVREGLVAEKVVIERATPASINLYGTTIQVRSHAETVADVLKEKNIQTLPDDVITPALDTPLEENTQVIIARVGKQIDTVEEEIPAPVETINDATMLAGTSTVREAGRPGRKLVTYEIEMRNDREVGRKVLQEVIAVEPIKRVVIQGTKVVYSNPSANVALGQEIAAQMGWSHEFSCIYQIFQRESRWNHLARNRSSGAYGIPQALPGSKMGPGWQTDPAVQIRWGINYMVARYGSPCRAYSFWQVNHWY
jgi:resuscitation-promoting factor RpfB